MSDIKVSEDEIVKLKNECFALEAKMAKIMLELLEELDKQKGAQTNSSEIKEGITILTNKILEMEAEGR